MGAADRQPDCQASGGRHLVVLVHGLWGAPCDLAYLEACMRDYYGSCIDILNSGCNAGSRTYDGVDVCGSRSVSAQC